MFKIMGSKKLITTWYSTLSVLTLCHKSTQSILLDGWSHFAPRQDLHSNVQFGHQLILPQISSEPIKHLINYQQPHQIHVSPLEPNHHQQHYLLKYPELVHQPQLSQTTIVDEHHGKTTQTKFDIIHDHSSDHQHQATSSIFIEHPHAQRNEQQEHHDSKVDDKDHDASYQFEYSVKDHKTGDYKNHKEDRKGDVVRGEYSLLESDGNHRTVRYYADWKTGFHAEVINSKTKA